MDRKNLTLVFLIILTCLLGGCSGNNPVESQPALIIEQPQSDLVGSWEGTLVINYLYAGNAVSEESVAILIEFGQTSFAFSISNPIETPIILNGKHPSKVMPFTGEGNYRLESSKVRFSNVILRGIDKLSYKLDGEFVINLEGVELNLYQKLSKPFELVRELNLTKRQ